MYILFILNIKILNFINNILIKKLLIYNIKKQIIKNERKIRSYPRNVFTEKFEISYISR